jgi:hypothetical protein
VVLYGCETWSRTLREEHRLRAFENKELKRICGLNRTEMTGGQKNCLMRILLLVMEIISVGLKVFTVLVVPGQQCVAF